MPGAAALAVAVSNIAITTGAKSLPVCEIAFFIVYLPLLTANSQGPMAKVSSFQVSSNCHWLLPIGCFYWLLPIGHLPLAYWPMAIGSCLVDMHLGHEPAEILGVVRQVVQIGRVEIVRTAGHRCGAGCRGSAHRARVQDHVE